MERPGAEAFDFEIAAGLLSPKRIAGECENLKAAGTVLFVQGLQAAVIFVCVAALGGLLVGAVRNISLTPDRSICVWIVHAFEKAHGA